MFRYPDLGLIDASEWSQIRAPELRRAFRELLYGAVPEPTRFAVEGTERLGPGARRLRLVSPEGVQVDALHVHPQGTPKATFVGIGFHGNHTVTNLEGVPLPTGWTYPGETPARGSMKGSWCSDKLVANGYGLVTFAHSDILPDDPRFAGEVGAIGLWGWGLASVATSFEGLGPKVLVGHSRMGKAALVAGGLCAAGDAVVAIQSGCGGAAPSRNSTGERVEDITRAFPHWFVPRFAEFAGREDALPIDQHMLLALCAPRPVFLPNAADDLWANPEGQRLMAELARPASDLLGGAVEYAVRPGGHSVTDEDWTLILDFVERRLLQ